MCSLRSRMSAMSADNNDLSFGCNGSESGPPPEMNDGGCLGEGCVEIQTPCLAYRVSMSMMIGILVCLRYQIERVSLCDPSPVGQVSIGRI